MITLAYIAQGTDPAFGNADAHESERKTPHVQPKPPISTNSLCGKQRKAGTSHECAKHVAPRGRLSATGRARPLKASEGHNKRNERNRVHGEPEEPRPPPLRASRLKPQTEAAGEIGGEDHNGGGRQVPDEERHDVDVDRHGCGPR